MKKINSAIAFIALLLSISSCAKENNIIGSGSITFVGAIVDGGCSTQLDKNNFKTSCWNGEEMKETSYQLSPSKKLILI